MASPDRIPGKTIKYDRYADRFNPYWLEFLTSFPLNFMQPTLCNFSPDLTDTLIFPITREISGKSKRSLFWQPVGVFGDVLK